MPVARLRPGHATCTALPACACALSHIRKVDRIYWLSIVGIRFRHVREATDPAINPEFSHARRPRPRQNCLLAALPQEEYARLTPHLKLVPMPLGTVLYESGNKLRHVYFPTTAIVSLLYVMIDGASAEIAVVGSDGIIGVALFMGGETMPNRAVVQSAGHAYRLEGQLLKQEFNRSGELQHLLLRYTQATAKHALNGADAAHNFRNAMQEDQDAKGQAQDQFAGVVKSVVIGHWKTPGQLRQD